jgi:hypothetical protein
MEWVDLVVEEIVEEAIIIVDRVILVAITGLDLTIDSLLVESLEETIVKIPEVAEYLEEAIVKIAEADGLEEIDNRTLRDSIKVAELGVFCVLTRSRTQLLELQPDICFIKEENTLFAPQWHQ